MYKKFCPKIFDWVKVTPIVLKVAPFYSIADKNKPSQMLKLFYVPMVTNL